MTEEQIKQIGEYDLETAMKHLDEVVERLSRENISLEDSLALYEEGVALVKHCTQRLEAAERKIKILRTTDEGEIYEEPLDTASI